MSEEQKITADDIRKALENYYPLPEWSLMFEVGNGTGANLKRHADGVAMNMYPSRGYEVRGFEIKVSRSDLQHEIAQAAKAEAVCQYCDTWFLVVPKGLTKGVQIPLPWGIIEYNEGKLRITKQAEQLTREAMPMQFIAGLLRAQERAYNRRLSTVVEDTIRTEKPKWERNGAWELEKLQRKYSNINTKLAEIREQTGLNMLNWTPTEEIIAKLNAIHSAYEVKDTIRTLSFLQTTAERVLGEIKDMQKHLTEADIFPESEGVK